MRFCLQKYNFLLTYASILPLIPIFFVFFLHMSEKCSNFVFSFMKKAIMNDVKRLKSANYKTGGVKCLFASFITNTAQSWYSAFC